MSVLMHIESKQRLRQKKRYSAMKEKTDVDPKSIDLKEAYCMCEHMRKYRQPENEGKSLTYRSDGFPIVINFDDLDKIEPPAGYALNKANRNIKIWISTFSGYCPGAKHYYCDIKFEGPTLKDEKNGFTYSFGKPSEEVGDIFGFHKIELYRRLTDNDLADKNIDWDYYDVGYMTHRWNDAKNAIAYAKKVIKLRFKNYGKITVINNA